MLLKQGFSFTAAIFGAPWALYYKMWLVIFCTVTIHVILSYFIETHIIIWVIESFIFGFFASDMREYYIHESGYKLSDIILAKDEEEAELKYYTRKQIK